MSLIETFLLSISLALDAAVAAVGIGVLDRKNARIFRVALLFGVFQGGMAYLGFMLGYGLRDYMLAYGPIVGFVLLMIVGGKMLVEAFKDDNANVSVGIDSSKLVILAIATSIDALVVGVTFNFIEVNLFLAVVLIGVVTFILSLLGGYVGTRGKRSFGNRIEILGAVVLILLAFKILLVR